MLFDFSFFLSKINGFRYKNIKLRIFYIRYDVLLRIYSNTILGVTLFMKNRKFPKHLLSILICGCMTSEVYSTDSEITNPHSKIGLTKQISEQYSGRKVNIGVLDSGYMVEHPFVNEEKLHSLKFVSINSKGETLLFDPSHYDKETEKDEKTGKDKTVYSMHGGQVAGIIGAKSSEQEGYEGGIAKNADVYITTFEPQQQDQNGADEASENEEKNADLLLGTGSDEKDHQRVIAMAFNKLAEKKVFAINNSWNEDPLDDYAQTMDNKYKEGITKATNNSLLNTVKSAVKNDTLIVFAAGNESKKQPGIMAALPRYLPELEKHYLSVVAVDDGKNLADYSNYCGVSKNWCIAAPGSLTVLATEGAEKDEKTPSLQDEAGTSFAAPTVTGALAVLKERFNYFTPTQVRDTLLTTATDLGQKGVDDIFGWGLVNLSKAINGPSQLLRDETYTISRNDKWTNNLIGKYTLTKEGSGKLTLAGEYNQLKSLVINEGNLTLTGKTSVDHVNNSSVLAIKALTVNQTFQSSIDSRLDILSPQAFIAQGNNTLVELNGTLSVTEVLPENIKPGDTIADVLVVKDGASYIGGFERLISSDNLHNNGLRCDLYFKPDRVELKANLNKPFSDINANEKGRKGLQILISLRDTKMALRKGFYNDWLQKAVEHNDLQNLHYYVNNSIYVDGLAFLHHQAIVRLLNSGNNVFDYSPENIDEIKIWLDGNGQKYQSEKNNDERAEVKTRYSGFGIAYKANEKVILNGNLSYIQSDLTKNQATATVKQIEAGVALRYMPLENSWFTDIIGKIAKVDYKQYRLFDNVTLGAGSNRGWLLGGEWRTGYGIVFDDWRIEPTIGLQMVHLSIDKLKENGELATLTEAFKKTNINLSSGLHLKRNFYIGDWKFSPDLTLNYVRLMNSRSNNIQSTLSGIKIDNVVTFDHYLAQLGVGMMIEKNNWFFATNVEHYQFKNGNAINLQAKIGLTFQ